MRIVLGVLVPQDPDLVGPGGVGGMSDSTFSGLFGLVALLVVVGVIASVAVAVHRWNVSRREGLDPFAADVQVMGRLRHAAALAPVADEPPTNDARPTATVEERLAELDDLHVRGVISAAERDTTRARILAEL